MILIILLGQDYFVIRHNCWSLFFICLRRFLAYLTVDFLWVTAAIAISRGRSPVLTSSGIVAWQEFCKMLATHSSFHWTSFERFFLNILAIWWWFGSRNPRHCCTNRVKLRRCVEQIYIVVLVAHIHHVVSWTIVRQKRWTGSSLFEGLSRVHRWNPRIFGG